jgi:hypothetical protein
MSDKYISAIKNSDVVVDVSNSLLLNKHGNSFCVKTYGLHNQPSLAQSSRQK